MGPLVDSKTGGHELLVGNSFFEDSFPFLGQKEERDLLAE